MFARSLGVLAVLAVAGIGPVVADENKEAEKLGGAWVGTAAADNGQPVGADEARLFRLVFTGSEYMAANGKTTIMRGTFTTDPGRKPKTIDLNSLSGRYRGKVLKGIYDLDGNTLRICFVEPDRQRPHELKSTSDNAAFYLQCTRRK